MASGVAYHHSPWMVNTVDRRRAWNAIIAFGQPTRSIHVGRGMPSYFEKHTRSKDVECSMISPPLGSTHGRTMLGVTCHPHLWIAHTVERRRAWHAIITFGQYKQSDGIGRGIPSSPLYGEHGRTTSGVACIIAFAQQTRSNDVGRGMPSWPLNTTHDRTKAVVACHHSP